MTAAFNWALCHVEPLKSAVNLKAIHDEIQRQGHAPLGYDVVTFSVSALALIRLGRGRGQSVSVICNLSGGSHAY